MSGIRTARCPAGTDPLVVESASGVRLRLAEPADGRTRAGRRHVVLVVGDPRLQPPGAQRGGARAAGADEPCDVRRAHPRARRTAGEAACRDHARARCEHVFLADSGSVSVEVAVKMCLQYWRSLGRPAQAAAADLARRLPRRHLAADVGVRPRGRDARAVDRGAAAAGLRGRAAGRSTTECVRASICAPLIARHADELAAVIVEPVVQGAGGMRFHSPAYLRVLREACDEHDVLLVFDEIATGFGRTGALFAAEHAAVHAGCDVRGQGADRRLSDDGGDAVHRAGGRRHLAGRGAGARPRPDLHGQPAGRGRRLRLDRAAARPGLAAGGQADRGGAAGRAGAGRRSCRG